MQVVIEIPEEEYRLIRRFCDINANKTSSLAMSIINGIILPSGHGRLIDADSIDLQRKLFGYLRYTGIDEFPYEDATKATFDAPTLVPPHKEVIKRG